jgi:hypothetical protein
MSHITRTVVIWAPRLLGAAVTALEALPGLDVFDGRPLASTVPDFLIHLVPAALTAAATAVGWRFPWAGAAAFALLAASYAAMTAANRPDWTLAVSGPLALVAALFAVSAATRARTAAGR